jgi:hypothetical protein
VTAGEPLYPPSNSGNSSPFTEGRKKVVSITGRSLQGVTYPAYPSLRNTTVATGKKKPQNPSYRDIRD